MFLFPSRYEIIDEMCCDKCVIPKTKETYRKYYYLIDWTSIVCAKKHVTHDTIAELGEFVDFVAVATYVILTEDLIRKYYEKIPLSILLSVQCVPCEILYKIASDTLSSRDWNNIWKNQAFPFDFVQRNIQHVNWPQLSSNPKALSFELIDAYCDVLVWPEITQHGLPEDVIEKYMHKLDVFSWSNICCYSKLSSNFIRKHMNKIDATFVMHCQELEENLILELINKENEVDKIDLWLKTASHQKLTKSFILANKEHLPLHLLIRNPKIKRNDLYNLFI
jgi:hypothetical protein